MRMESSKLSGISFSFLPDDFSKYNLSSIKIFIDLLSSMDIMPGINIYEFTSVINRLLGMHALPMFEDCSRFLAISMASTVPSVQILPNYLYTYNTDIFLKIINVIKREYDSLGDRQIDWYDVQYWFTRFDLGQADIAMEGLQPRVKYYPETKDVLKKLDGVYRLSVASGSPRPFLKHLLRDTKHHFSSIFSSTSDFQQVKTAEFYKYMCSLLQVEPRQVVHVGDHRQFDCLEPAGIGIRAYYLDREGKSGDPAAVRDLAQFANILNGL